MFLSVYLGHSQSSSNLPEALGQERKGVSLGLEAQDTYSRAVTDPLLGEAAH